MRWDRASEGLVVELTCPRPHPERIRALITARQQLMTANPRAIGDDRRTEDAQRAWLENAMQREAEIRKLYEVYMRMVNVAVDTHRTGARTRAAFGDKVETIPGRLSKKV
ncbi:MAG: hypothetical protein HC923_09480 [Myxococcales bacterium]|nr:hypothetical protein [Myxococcales bacterium]